MLRRQQQQKRMTISTTRNYSSSIVLLSLILKTSCSFVPKSTTASKAYHYSSFVVKHTNYKYCSSLISSYDTCDALGGGFGTKGKNKRLSDQDKLFDKIVTTTTSRKMSDNIGKNTMMNDNVEKKNELLPSSDTSGLADATAVITEGDKNDQDQTTLAQPAPSPSPVRKQHTISVCLVPPPSEKEAWDALTKARTELKDPGLYRWPPHANLLYPFVTLRPSKTKEQKQERVSNNENTDDDKDDTNSNSSSGTESHDLENTANVDLVGKGQVVQADIVMKLRNATKQIEPFKVTLDTFGTFGGKQRGVLWLYPRSSHHDPPAHDIHDQSSSSEDAQGEEEDQELEEPLSKLQGLLENEFPACTDQRKIGQTFTPHITLSHYPNLDEAKIAQSKIESWWEPQSFLCTEIYLLERKDDDGQFLRIAALPLGGKEVVGVDDGTSTSEQEQQEEEEDEIVVVTDPRRSANDDSSSLGYGTKILVYDPPSKFPDMPDVEEDWVREERMKMKERRNRRPGRRKRGPRRSKQDGSRDTADDRRGPSRSKDTPEIIAQKRAERKAKRERLEREQRMMEPLEKSDANDGS